MSIFVATPTHYAKRYCAAEFAQTIQDNCLKKHKSVAMIASNSRQKCEEFYLQGLDLNAPESHQPTFHQMTEADGLDSLCYGHQGSIHRRVVTTMNFMRDVFLQLLECEWFLSLESDVMLLPDTIQQILDRANGPDKPMVVYTHCYHGFLPNTEWSQTHAITLGCTLLHRSVVEMFPFKYDPSMLRAFHDAILAHECNGAGVPMYYDPNITPIHRERSPGDRGWNEFPQSEK